MIDKSKRMKLAHKVLKKLNPDVKPGTKEFGQLMSVILSYDHNSSGKKHNGLKRQRAKVCRSKGKISKC